MQQIPRTDPSDLIALRDGIYADDLVIAAVAGLDFFTWLAKNTASEEGIAAGLELSPRPLNVLLTLCLAMGLVERDGEAFRPSRLAEEHLVQGSPWNLGPFFSSQWERPQCRELLEVLKTGKPASWSSTDEGGAWESRMEEDGFAASFTAAMDSRGAYLAPGMAENLPCEGYANLLDIAGGSGIYACSVASRHPHMRAAILEKPPVDRVAERSIAERGMSERVGVLAGDMFAEPLPTGFDMHLWSHVLHDWDLPQVAELLARSCASLMPGGMVVIHDAHINADRTGPLAVARFSVLLMHSTVGRCYSVAEMGRLLAEAGFGEISCAPAVAHRSLITAKKL